MNRLIYILILMVLGNVSTDIFATSLNSGMPEILDVRYQYSMVDNGGWDCEGTLKLKIGVSPGCRNVLLRWTSAHLTDDSDLRFLLVSAFRNENNESVMEIEQPDLKWGTYFKVEELLDNDERNSSAVYCTDSYISHKDLEQLMNPSGIWEIEDSLKKDTLKIEVKGDGIEVSSEEDMVIELYDLGGLSLYHGDVGKDRALNIPVSNRRIIIVRYHNDNINGSKKIIMK